MQKGLAGRGLARLESSSKSAFCSTSEIEAGMCKSVQTGFREAASKARDTQQATATVAVSLVVCD